jgi:CHASE2 domain-containing sensor protein
MSHKTNRQIFGVPILLGIATMLGLGAGLIGDGGWDTAAGLLLAAPLVVTAWYWRRPSVSPARGSRSQRFTIPA